MQKNLNAKDILKALLDYIDELKEENERKNLKLEMMQEILSE